MEQQQTGSVVQAEPRQKSKPDYGPAISFQARELFRILRNYLRSSTRRGKDFCWPGQAKLAEHLGRSIRSVQYYLGELEEVGLIKIVRTVQGNRYYLLSPNDAEEAHAESCVSDTQDVAPRHAESCVSDTQDVADAYRDFSRTDREGTDREEGKEPASSRIGEPVSPLKPAVPDVPARTASTPSKLTPEHLAQSFHFYQVGKKQWLEDVTTIFREKVRHGLDPQKIDAEINRPDRDRDERTWDFFKRFKPQETKNGTAYQRRARRNDHDEL